MPEHKLTYKEVKPSPGFNVQLCLGVKETKGDIGIEIEVEGNKFPKPAGYEETHKPEKLPGSEWWSYVKDGSLRGYDNAEYVLTKPIDFDNVSEAVIEIYKIMVDYGSVLDVSNRTSVHIHLNCQSFHMDRLTTFVCLWFILEEILTEWCGDHRVGNMFCLRALDAPAIVSNLKKFIKADGDYPIGEIFHYAGLNPSALMKYGSLEIRTLRGCTEPKTILDWVAILRRLYILSGEYVDPRKLVSKFSQYGPLPFFDLLLGDLAATVIDGITMSPDQLALAMRRGIRFAQDLCYCRDWSLYKPVNIAADPFGRDLRKVAAQLMAPTEGLAAAPVPTDPFAELLNAIQEQEPQEYEPEYDNDYPDPEIGW